MSGFSVAQIKNKGDGLAPFAIRYTPPAKINPDGSQSISLSFPVLVATEDLNEPEETLKIIAGLLNASPYFE